MCFLDLTFFKYLGDNAKHRPQIWLTLVFKSFKSSIKIQFCKPTILQFLKKSQNSEPMGQNWALDLRPKPLSIMLPSQIIGLPRWCSGKESAWNAGDTGDAGSILELGRSLGEGNGNPLQYSCLENSMDRGVWPATVHGVTKSQTWLSKHKQP